MSAQTPPADERIFTDETLGYELFWQKNKKTILLGIATVVALALATGLYFLNQHNRSTEAAKAFALATDEASWTAVMEKFPGTMPAVSSALMVAASQRQGGDLKASTATYNSLLARLPKKHPLEGLALLGLAENASASGNNKESLEQLRVTATSSSPFAAQLAILLEGRQLSESGQITEARRAFESLSAEFPESLAARVARSQAEQLSIVDPGQPK